MFINIYFIFSHFQKYIFFITSLFSKKAKKGYLGRKKIYPKITKTYDIWIHCASSGEFIAIEPIIDKLLTAKKKIIVTYFSSSGFSFLKDGITFVYMPYDTPFQMRKFILATSIKKIFLVKWDLWPNMIFEAKKKNIKIILFNADYSNKKHLKGFVFNNYKKKLLLKIDKIFVSNKVSQKNIKSHSISSEYIGDLRYNVVIKNKKKNFESYILNDFCKKNRIVVFGSSHSSDEKIIDTFIAKTNKYKIIIAPHEVNDKNIKQLKNKYQNSATYSEYNKNSKVLIIDSYGLLSYIYQFANFAYVGGGFGSGVHNVLEPAIFGIPVFMGNKKNGKVFFEEIELEENNILFKITSGNDMINIINKNIFPKKEEIETFFTKKEIKLDNIINKII